ncbi:hypothetical protein BCR43DRAFT_486892 [Syncephalastrum racemosum]|uniref:Transcription elongation factor Eaf N-terminal domain-containing protein n=1 Tax=Syncephalastrum racemosum TaxID=13706 RepID=A0A1X2HPX6_SYNRA|nr:hypothetical protein BCR43DRAFT_486892 [Syncephalastrum racemosum]
MDSPGELHDGTYELKLGRSIFQRADPEYVLMSFQSHDPITEDGSSTLTPNRNGYSASFKYGDKDATYEMEDSESTDQIEALIVYDEATKSYRLELPTQHLSIKGKALESESGNRTRKKKREDGKQSRRQSVDDDFSKDIESQLMEVLDNDDDDEDEEDEEEDESDKMSDAQATNHLRQPPKPAKPPKRAKTPPPAKPAISSPALALPTRPTSASPVQRRNIPMASRPIRRPDSPPPPAPAPAPAPPAAPRTGGKRPQQYGGKTVLRRPPASPHSRRRNSTSSTDSSSGSSTSGSSGSSSGSSSSGSGSSSEDDDDDDDDDMDDLEADIAESLSTPTEAINGKPSTGGKSIAAAAAQHHQQQQQQSNSGPRSLRALFSDDGDDGDEDEGMTSSSDSD